MTYKKALEFAKGGLQTYYEKYPELTEQIEFQEAIIDALEKVDELEEENIILKKEVLKFCESELFSCHSCPLTDDCPMNVYKISIEQASNRLE